MLRRIDQRNGLVLFKVINTTGKLIAYRVIPVDSIGSAGAEKDYPTLTEARQRLGVLKAPIKKTLPKAAYIQNTPGYRADRKR